MAGAGIFDICTTVTYDEERGITYPAWTVANPEDIKMAKRAVDPNAVPLIYSVKTPDALLYEMHVNAKNMFDKDDITLLADPDEAVEYFEKHYKYYAMTDEDLKARLLAPYIQTSAFVNEATNLKQTVKGGYIKLEELSGRRKDRAMALVYGLYYVKKKEEELTTANDELDLSAYVLFG